MTQPDTPMRQPRTIDELMAPLIAEELAQADKDEARRKKQAHRARASLTKTLRGMQSEPFYSSLARKALRPIAAAASIILGLSSFDAPDREVKKTPEYRTEVTFAAVNAERQTYEQLREGFLDYPIVSEEPALNSIVGPRRLPDGYPGSKRHKGNDYSATARTRVVLPRDGTVVKSSRTNVAVESGIFTFKFSHATPRAKAGTTLQAYDTLATVATRNRIPEGMIPHLHIEAYLTGNPQPLNFYCLLKRPIREQIYQNLEPYEISALQNTKSSRPAAEQLEARCEEQALALTAAIVKKNTPYITQNQF